MLSNDPDCVESLLNLGEVRVEQQKFEEAVRSLRNAAKLRPRVASLQFELAEALRQMSDHSAAAEAYKRGLSLQARSFDGWMGLGISSSELNLWRDAVASFKHALAIEPNSDEARDWLAGAEANLKSAS